MQRHTSQCVRAMLAGAAVFALTAGQGLTNPIHHIGLTNPFASGPMLVQAEGGVPEAWAGGDPDFCESCGGEVIDTGDGIGDGAPIDVELGDPPDIDLGAGDPVVIDDGGMLDFGHEGDPIAIDDGAMIGDGDGSVGDPIVVMDGDVPEAYPTTALGEGAPVSAGGVTVARQGSTGEGGQCKGFAKLFKTAACNN
ncbi:MAG: hypothetical protein WCC57_13455 [Paracoccaceae bacterium]